MAKFDDVIYNLKLKHSLKSNIKIKLKVIILKD